MSLNVAMAYHNGDRERAVEWLTLCAKWKALENHKLYLLPAFDCPPIPEIVPFTGLTDYLQVSSNWRTANGIVHACASGPNSMVRQFARYFYENKLGPFFFVESDCIPLRPEAFDKLEEEYIACGKPYLGGFAPMPVPHVNGNQIMPQNAALLSTLMLPMRSDDGTRDIAFDVAAAREILPQAHCTELIQHLWRGPSFTSQEDFDTRIRKDALFYHQCRDGSIYKYLNGGVEPKLNPEWENALPEIGPLNEVSPFAALSKQDGVFRPSEDEQYVREYTAAGKTSFAEFVPTLKQRRQAQAAKARAALAAKRATGWRPTKKRRKRGKSKD